MAESWADLSTQQLVEDSIDDSVSVDLGIDHSGAIGSNVKVKVKG